MRRMGAGGNARLIDDQLEAGRPAASGVEPSDAPEADTLLAEARALEEVEADRQRAAESFEPRAWRRRGRPKKDPLGLDIAGAAVLASEGRVA